MITEETKKRASLIFLIVAAICGLLFLIWAVFLNRGTITVKAKAPYTLQIPKVGSIACVQDECSTVVAPGRYQITLQKNGYKNISQDIEVPLHGKYEQEFTFQFVPLIQEVGDTGIFPKKNYDEKSLNLDPGTAISFTDSGDYVAYIQRDPDNFRQTLYVQKMADNKPDGAPVVATSFLRDLSTYFLTLSPSHQRVIVVDQQNTESTLYLIDLKTKDRRSLFTYPFINYIQWIPESQNFLFQARDPDTFTDTIYYAKAAENSMDYSVKELELKTPLDDIAPLDNERVIAATIQKIPGSDHAENLEGTIVTLGETGSTKPALAFVDYSLVSNQGRVLKIIEDGALPLKLQANPSDKNAVYYLQNGKAYRFQFGE